MYVLNIHIPELDNRTFEYLNHHPWCQHDELEYGDLETASAQTSFRKCRIHGEDLQYAS